MKKEEYVVPYPQADNIYLVLEIAGICNREKSLYPQSWARRKGYAVRQGYLYLNAGVFLGLLKKNRDKSYSLTEEAQYLFDNSGNIDLLMYKKLFESNVFFSGFLYYELTNTLIPKEKIIKTMNASMETEKINKTTINRRANTTIKWIEYFINQGYSVKDLIEPVQHKKVS